MRKGIHLDHTASPTVCQESRQADSPDCRCESRVFSHAVPCAIDIQKHEAWGAVIERLLEVLEREVRFTQLGVYPREIEG